MSLYTERHGMRSPIETTYDISLKAYSLLYDCCEKYYENLAWKYPEYCPDSPDKSVCCGINLTMFNEDMEYEIPTLFRRDGMIDKPHSTRNVFEAEPRVDSYDQFALLDLIEFIAQNIRDITRRNNHSYYRHDHITFDSTNETAGYFVKEINSIFKKTGLLYQLTDQLLVERIEEATVLSKEMEVIVNQVQEPGLKELVMTAIQKHKSPYPSDQRDAVEKIWDAFERLKTYYTTMDKKASAARIVNDMAGGNATYIDLFNTEFEMLTKIGNNYRIRHHETNKTDITDQRHYDYFFNRCLSLIALAIQYLQ